MKAYVPHYELITPRNFSEALRLMENGDITPFAGGTDLMVLFEAGLLPEKKYLNVASLKELKGIRVDKNFITIGAATTYAEIIKSAAVKKEFPLLIKAALVTGARAIQNRGTLGGNIINASPAADSPPALLVYDTELELVSTDSSRWVSFENFYIDYKKTQCQKSELLKSIRIRRNGKFKKHIYRKVGTRKAQAISKVCFAATANLDKSKKISQIRLAFGSVAPIPKRCPTVEEALTGKKVTKALVQEAIEKLKQDISPIDDIRSTKEYRLQVSQNLLAAFLENL